MEKTYCYSTNGEIYHGSFPTREEAVAEALKEVEVGQPFWTGVCVPPTQPEGLWHAEDWLEHASMQDEYSGECAEYWDASTKEQRAELEREVRAVMAAWLDKHDLRPKFWIVTEIEKHEQRRGRL